MKVTDLIVILTKLAEENHSRIATYSDKAGEVFEIDAVTVENISGKPCVIMQLV